MMDITPLIQYLSRADDPNSGAVVIRWLHFYKSDIMQHEPMLALYINEALQDTFHVDLIAFDDVEICNRLLDADANTQTQFLEKLHTLVDIIIIYQSEGPFHMSDWKVRLARYENEKISTQLKKTEYFMYSVFFVFIL